MRRLLGAAKRLRELRSDRRGAVAVYAAFISAAALGGGVLALDVGRMVALRAQMQNAADAAALSAATQLTGQPGSIARAQNLAQQGLLNETALSDNPGAFTIQSITFFRQVDPTRIVTTDDFDAAFVEVTLNPQQITLLLKPALDYIASSQNASNISTLNASATATYEPVVCNAPPFMACDPTENGSSNDDLMDPSNAGRQLLVKENGGGSFAPGQYGLLCPTGTNCGASEVGDAIAAENPGTCYGANVDTSPGSQTQQVRNGLNARFDTGNQNPKKPAKDIMPYSRDSNMNASTRVGNGSWNPNSYWSANHPSDPAPSGLSGYSRYQVYLYEMGETFARNGKRTLYPAPSPLPAGYTLVTPPGASIPAAGVPTSAPSSLVKRRVVKLAVLRCVALNVQGSGSYPTFGRYVEAFLTEPVSSPPNADIYGEIIGPLTSRTSSDFHGNVRLVD